MNSIFLPDEIITEILKKASLKSLHRLKWVSKAWYSLVNNEVLLPQLVKYQNPCIYYKYDDAEPAQPFISIANPTDDHITLNSFDFLPDSKDLFIIDSCNGLVLCCTSCENTRYFVCNPVDKTCNQISGVEIHSAFYLLDFNPLKSPHYNLVVLRGSSLSRGALVFDVYHSNTRRFQQKLAHVQHLTDIEAKRSKIALWNGHVYFECIIEDYRSDEPGWKVLKISGVLQGGAVSYGFIRFPGGIQWSRKGEICGYMGTWKERLRFVSISAQGIKVWGLRDTDEDEWRLEHDCATTFLGLSEHYWLNHDKTHIVGFHPIRNAVLILFKRLLYAFDFDRSSFEIFWEFEHDRVSTDYLFSFFPCFANQVLA